MAFLDKFVLDFYQIFMYSMQCSSLPMSTLACSMFWAVIHFIGAFIAFCVFVATLRFLINERLDFIRYLKKKERQAKVAEPEVMAKYKWSGD